MLFFRDGIFIWEGGNKVIELELKVLKIICVFDYIRFLFFWKVVCLIKEYFGWNLKIKWFSKGDFVV